MVFAALILGVSPISLAAPPAQEPQERMEAKDTDGDGKPDEWRVYQDKTLVRMERDRDEDGRHEIVVYLREGKPIRSEVDRNGDGTPDLVRLMKEGRPEKERGDLNFDGKWDAWVYYNKDGFKDLMIMDKNYDGKPDAYFYYGQSGTKLTGGRVDTDFDGTFDRTFGNVPEKETRGPWAS